MLDEAWGRAHRRGPVPPGAARDGPRLAVPIQMVPMLGLGRISQRAEGGVNQWKWKLSVLKNNSAGCKLLPPCVNCVHNRSFGKNLGKK